MKTIFYFLAIVMASFFVNENASAQYQRGDNNPYNRGYEDECRDGNQQSFYYYPQSNLYYSFSTGKYIFLDRNAWVVSDRLPRYYRLRREPRFVVYHNGFDVWNENRFHAMKYRNYGRSNPDAGYDNHSGYTDRNYPQPRDDNWRR